MRSTILMSLAFASLLAVSVPVSAQTERPILRTPDDAIHAYIDAVAKQDFQAVLATVGADLRSERFDFVQNTARQKSASVRLPAPSSSPFFIALNKAQFEALAASQAKAFPYSLMTTHPVGKGDGGPMSEQEAQDFGSIVRADRLSTLKIKRIDIPNPAAFSSESSQRNMARYARAYGADAKTERVALVSFEGVDFYMGFMLLKFGDEWLIESQQSGIGGNSFSGDAERITEAEYEMKVQ